MVNDTNNDDEEGTGGWPVLSGLRRAVKKIRFLLSFHARRWRHLPSILLHGAAANRMRRLSFNDRAGLRTVCSDREAEEEGDAAAGSGSTRRMERIRSYGNDSDIDRRAELFIENFYRQLRLERQISLELRYCRYNRGNSSCSDDSSSSSFS